MARILIIDNDPLLLQLLGMHIARNGHEVVPASGAIEGLRLLLEQDFDAVITDVEMPYMDGIEVAKAIRGDPRTSHLPILLLTAHGGDEIEGEALALHALHVAKPVPADHLLGYIEKMLEKKKSA